MSAHRITGRMVYVGSDACRPANPPLVTVGVAPAYRRNLLAKSGHEPIGSEAALIQDRRN